MTDSANNSPPQNSYVPQHWGFWGTIGFGSITIIIFGLLQTTFFFVSAIFTGKVNLELLDKDKSKFINSLEKLAFNGDLISLAEIPSALIGIGLIFIFISSRNTLTIPDYLQLSSPTNPIKTFLKWIVIMIIVFIIMEGTNIVLEHETPESMLKIYDSTDNKVLLWIAVAIAAPFFEEILFRGFLLEGLRHSIVGVVGAIIITSASWALIHLASYGWFEIISIFFIGIIFAIAQLKTKSLYVPIAMHMFMNLTASIMMEVTS